MNDSSKPTRCAWCTADPLYQAYHDHEWGRPVFDDQSLFERLALEGMQAGLSWLTVLKKREAMRQRFNNFDIAWLATKGAAHLNDWLDDPRLIRHRGKLQALIHNAGLVYSLKQRTGDTAAFTKLLWGFAPYEHFPRLQGEVPTFTEEAQVMAKTLKRQGFKFVGPTICYAFMQSVGMVNDHTQGCFVYESVSLAWENKFRTKDQFVD